MGSKASKRPDQDRKKYLDKLNSIRRFSAVADRKGRLQFASEDPVKVFGYSQDDFLRKPFWEALWFTKSPESQDAVREGILQALKGKGVECRVKAFTSDGDAIPVTFNISPLKGSDGDIVSIQAETEPLDTGTPQPLGVASKPQESQERLGSVLELMEEAYFETDSSERLTLLSASAASILGYGSPDDMVGMRTAALWANADERDKFLVELSRKGKVRRYRTSFLNKDGTELPVEVSANLLLDAEGDVSGSQVIFAAIAGDEEFGKQPVHSEGYFRSLIENAVDCFAVVDSAGRMIYQNPSTQRLFGYTSEEQFGKQFLDFVLPNDVPHLLDVFSKVMKAQGATAYAVFRAKHKDGSWRYIEGFARNLLDDPEVKGCVVNYRDITERKRVEEAKEETEKRFRALIEKSNDGFLILGADGKLTYASPSHTKMFPSWDTQDMSTWVQAIHPDDTSKAIELFAEVLAARGATVATDIRARDSNNVWHDFEVTGTNYVDDPAVGGIVVNLHDVTERKKAEETLLRIGKAVESSSDAIGMSDPEGHHFYHNKAFTELLEYTPEELAAAGGGPAAFADQDTAREVFGAIMKGESWSGELEMASKSGRRIPALMRADAIKDEFGAIIGLIGVITDFTERKKAERELEGRERRFRQLFTDVNDLVALSDVAGNLLEVNGKIRDLFGLSVEECVGRNFADMGVFPQEELAKIAVRFARAWEAQQAVEPTIQVSALHRDGRHMYVEVSTSSMISPEGKLEGFIVVIRDITDRKEAEDALRESEERYRLVAHNMLDIIFILDLELRLKYISPSVSKISDYTVEELMQTTIDQLVAPEHLDFAAKMLAEELAVESSGSKREHYGRTMEMQFYRKDGSRYWMEVNMTFLRDADGKPTAILGVARDIEERKQAEKALRESEERYRLIAESMTDIIVVMGFDLRMKYISPSVTKLGGYTVGEALQLMPDQYMPAEHFERVTQMMNEETAIEASGQKRAYRSRTIEVELINKDGTRVWVEETYSLIRDAEGKPTAILVVIHDIAERRQAEEALRSAQKRYLAVFNNPLNLVFVCDEQGRFVDANEAALKCVGYSKEDLGKLTFQDIIADPDDLAVALRDFLEDRSSEERRPPIEIRLRSKENEVVWVEVYGARSQDPGEAPLLMGIARDITDRKMAEEALLESEKRFRTIIESASDAVSITNKDGGVWYASPSVRHVIGYKPGELVGKSIFDLIHAEDKAKAMQAFGAFLSEPRTAFMQTIRLRHKDGSWRVIELTARNFLDDPAIKGVVCNYRDVTERVHAEEELRQSQERLRDALLKLKVSYEELSTPVVQVWERVLVMPLIGVLDTARARDVMEVLLTKIVETRAEVVIIDITGVAVMDTQVTNHLLQTAASTGLLGTECVITGIKPEVAQAMIHIGADLAKLNTKRDLQDGLKYALAKISGMKTS